MNIATGWRGHVTARRLQIFVHDLGATGVVRNAIAVANEAAASGYRVRLLVCNAQGVLKTLVSPCVTIVELTDHRAARGSRRAQLQAAFLAYRKHSRDWTPDIMLSAGNHGHLLSTLAWLGLPGVKLLRFSNDLAHGAPGRFTRLWRAAKFRLMARLADRLVYVSRAQAGHPLLARELASGKALVIPNGVDVELVRAAAGGSCDLPWPGDGAVPMLLAVGRHVEQKNFPELLAAFALARASRPLRLLFLGDGSADEIRRMKQMAVKLGVDRDVAFLPATANPFPYMAAATAFALPSRWEGSANVLLEAIACGTPVIAARTAGDAEHVLDNGRYGVLVEPGKLQQLADAILLQTGPNAVRPGSRAAEFARNISMRRYVTLFDMLSEEAGVRSLDGTIGSNPPERFLPAA